MSSFLTSIFKPGAAKSNGQGDKEFIAQAMERWRLASESEAEFRRKSLNDFKFCAGEQWDPQIFRERDTAKRPCLTMNRLRQFRRMVSNEQRQQRPAIQINPVGDDADSDTAEVFSGIVRHIEYISKADIAYDTGFEHMITGGFGYWRIVNEYVDEDTDAQELYIRRVRNAFTVYFDPRAEEPGYTDALYAFVVADIPRELYKDQYPDSELASLLQFNSVGDTPLSWVNEAAVRIAEYYWVDVKPGKRGRDKREVHWAKINAVETLEGPNDVPGRHIPIVPVLGDDQIIDGKRDLVGLIRDAIDPQRMYNYQISAAAETIALAPKSPHIIAEGQIENHETDWEQSNRRNTAVLVYKPMSVAGQPVPPPQRNSAEPPIMAMAAMIRQADNDLKATTGIYDASLGQQGPEQSGKAVLARQKQSDIANLNFTDNLARSIRQTGDFLLEMIPDVYDKPRVQRIIKPDGTTASVGIYNSQNGGSPDDEVLSGVDQIYDIGVGTYDVTVSVGPSYQSKRQEAVASQLALVSSYPQIMGVAGDLIIGNMDWPGAKQIAARVKKTIPPQVQDEQPGAPDPQSQQQIAQLQQQVHVLGTALQTSQQVIQQKLIESQSKTNIALIDQQTRLNVARITASKDQDVARADREADMLQTMMGQAHDAGGQAMDAQHEVNMSQMPQPQQPGAQTQGATPAAGEPQPGGPPPTATMPGQPGQ